MTLKQNSNKELIWNIEKFESSIFSFLNWLKETGYHSNDKDDLLDTPLGLYVKKIFYKNKILGAPFAGVFLILENFFPFCIKYISSGRREAIADAQYASSFLNLYKIYNDSKFLEEAENLLSFLYEKRIKGYSGACWGYSKGWQTPYGFWPARTPCITVTPYVYWAFKKHYEITGKDTSLNICRSIAKFVFNDLSLIKMQNGTYGSQYSTLDKNGSVINATAYRAAVLADAARIFSNKSYNDHSKKNVEFILSYQNSDGSWPYTAIDSNNSMIDNFHTCFVIKNLITCYLINNKNKIRDSISAGINYYNKNLLHENGWPKHSSKAVLIKLRKYEMYDFAECINMYFMYSTIEQKYINNAISLSLDLINNFQAKDGNFFTRITTLNTSHRTPYHRWPQAQLLLSIINILSSFKKGSVGV